MNFIVDTPLNFLKDVEQEFKRISWPTIKESIRSTIAVIIISAVLAGFLGIVDFFFSLGVKNILG